MAYLRGDHYLWSDGDRLHIWARDGYDGWDEAGWHRGDSENSRNTASGVGIRQDVLDEYVVMRLAEMAAEGTVDAAIERVLDPSGQGGNFGGRTLRANAEGIREALRGLKMHPSLPTE